MSKNATTARHRATPAGSVALAGLSHTAKAHALTVGRPALAVAAASGLVFGVGAPAQASVNSTESAGAVQTTATAVPAPVTAAPAAATANVHTVVSGDTLGAISAAYGVSLADVLDVNNLGMASIIYPGDQIQIPGAGTVAAAPAPAVTVAAATAPAPAPAPAASPVNLTAMSSTAASTGSGTGAALLAHAYGQIGTYQDCTAMVEKALRSVGISVGDIAPSHFFAFGSVVSTPAPGDLVITAGHVGIYAGDGQVVSGGVDGNRTEVHSISWLSGASFVRVP